MSDLPLLDWQPQTKAPQRSPKAPSAPSRSKTELERICAKELREDASGWAYLGEQIGKLAAQERK
jgi:hypothetical protein